MKISVVAKNATDGRRVIDDNALVALTLMIAESNPVDKSMMIKVIVNLINNKQ